jgi:hypothetical protein
MDANRGVQCGQSSSGLNQLELEMKPGTIRAMNFVYASLTWIIIGIILGLGILLAVKGSYWLLILGALGFIFAVGKVCCAK